MTIELTYEQALEGLERAVAEKGEDYIDPRVDAPDGDEGECMNWNPDGTPSCIVGHILSYHGGTKDSIGEGTVLRLRDNKKLKADRLAYDLLAAAQDYQDRGMTWRDAVDIAKAETGADA